MDLVRDVLDAQVVDRNGRKMGRVDGIILDVESGTVPRVAAIEIGPSVLGYRINPALGRLVAALEYALGVNEGRPLRIPFADLTEGRTAFKSRVAVGETSTDNVDRPLRSWIAKIPGGG
jgi:sporulation protein YlmC with PRC-barrel domain